MKLNIYHYFLLFSTNIILIQACTSGKQALQRGSYDEAVYKAVSRLRSNPGHDKAQEALRTAYPLALQTIEMDIENTLRTNYPFKWAKVVNYYEQINRMYEEIRRAPGALQVIPNPVGKYQELSRAREKAAAEYYQAGELALGQGLRAKAKEAYFHFVKSQRYVPNFREVNEKIETAKRAATLKVVYEPFVLPSRFYNLNAEAFQNDIIQYLKQRNIDEFVEFYTAGEAEAERVYPDHIVQVQFEDFQVGESHIYEKEETIRKDSVKTGTVEVEGEEKPVYGTVEAKLRTFNKKLISKGRVTALVYDATTENLLRNESFEGQDIWQYSWATYQGDRRALSDEQYGLCRRKEINPPEKQKLFEGFTQPIYSDLTRWLRDYYKNF